MDTNSESVSLAGFSTRTIHVAQSPDPTTGALVTPIVTNVSFAQSYPYGYARVSNPTRDTLEKVMCSLEKAKHTFVLPSGNAAGSFITHIMKPGEHILACQDMYGGLVDYFDAVGHPIMKYSVSYVDFSNKEEFMGAFTEKTRLLWMESPTNPLLNIYDVKEICKICKEKNIYVVFDNTLFTPYLLNPLELGVDIVIHSGTKYIGGHSDIMMGFVCVNDETIFKRLNELYPQYGSCPSPFDCYLALRGLKTLSVRVKRAQENAIKLAKMLQGIPEVEEVYYPGLPTHPGYEINKRQARGTGALVSFKLKGADLPTAAKFCRSLHLFLYASSLGGVEGLICTPTDFTHENATPEFKKKVGVTDKIGRASCRERVTSPV